MTRLAQTARMLAAASADARFDWDRYAASQVAARNQFLADLDAADARNVRCEAMLNDLATGFLAGADEGCS